MAATKKKQQETTTPQVEARIDRLVDGDFKTKAFASATIGGAFAVHGIRVIESDKGRFISMPQDSYKKNGETKYAGTHGDFQQSSGKPLRYSGKGGAKVVLGFRTAHFPYQTAHRPA